MGVGLGSAAFLAISAGALYLYFKSKAVVGAAGAGGNAAVGDAAIEIPERASKVASTSATSNIVVEQPAGDGRVAPVTSTVERVP